MKFSSSLWLWALCSASTASAFTLPPSLSAETRQMTCSKTRLNYDIQRGDPSNENVWRVLATTERWISETLKYSKEKGGSTPLSRKEVSYVCETSTDAAMVLANIFRKLKEARQLGETHGEQQEEYMQGNEQKGPNAPVSMRQTQVLVIPSNPDLKEWVVFDNLVMAINQARRSARDYVTDVSLDKLDDRVYGQEDDQDWVVSVNCAHLHPSFGQKTPAQELKELQAEEQKEEIDLNLQTYKEQRLHARRSPFPSIVVEVRAMPPPVFTPPPPSGPTSPEPLQEEEIEGVNNPDSEFVQQLELLFSKSSLDGSSSSPSKDGFYDAIGSHLKEVTIATPMSMAQTWIAQNDDLANETTCAFTLSDTQQVDEAYEFLFTNLAMQTTQFLGKGQQGGEAQKRQYMVLPNFCTSSATSMEKFAVQATNIINTLPNLLEKVDIDCFHPEHIQADKRCPVPVFLLQWND